MELVLMSLYFFVCLFVLHIATKVIDTACDLIKIRIGVTTYGK